MAKAVLGVLALLALRLAPADANADANALPQDAGNSSALMETSEEEAKLAVPLDEAWVSTSSANCPAFAMEYQGYCYATMDQTPWNRRSYSCQTNFISMPAGWETVPDTPTVRSNVVARGYFSTHVVVLNASNIGQGIRTANYARPGQTWPSDRYNIWEYNANGQYRAYRACQVKVLMRKATARPPPPPPPPSPPPPSIRDAINNSTGAVGDAIDSVTDAGNTVSDAAGTVQAGTPAEVDNLKDSVPGSLTVTVGSAPPRARLALPFALALAAASVALGA